MPHGERTGPIEELCRWTVDLSPLPAFQQNAQLAREGNAGGGNQGVYTEFALGLVLDSAEVIGAYFPVLFWLGRMEQHLMRQGLIKREWCAGVLLTDEGEEVGRATFEFL